MADEIIQSANPEVAPAGGVVSGANLDAFLKKIQIQNDTLDRIIAEGKLKGADTRGAYQQKEDLRFEGARALDQAKRAQGEANVMGQVAEWKPAPGMEKIPNVSGIYRMPAATGVPPREESPQGSPYSRRFLEENMNYRRPIKGVDVPSIPGESAGDLRKRMEAQWKVYDEDEKVNSGTRMRNYEVGLLRRWADSGRPIPPDYVMSGTAGGHPLTSKELDIIIGEGKYKIANKPNPTYSNIGVMPGRTYGDFRKEKEYDQLLNLAEIKARETDSASDKLVRDRIKALARPKAELEKIIYSSDPLNTTENKNAARAELDKLDAQEAVLAAQIRGTRPARKPYEPEIKEGWDSYLGEAKKVTEASVEEKSAPAPSSAITPDRSPSTAVAKIAQLVRSGNPMAEKAIALFNQQYPQHKGNLDEVIRINKPAGGAVKSQTTQPSYQETVGNLTPEEPAGKNYTVKEFLSNPPGQGPKTATDYVNAVQKGVSQGKGIDFESFKKGIKATADGYKWADDRLMQLYQSIVGGLTKAGDAMLNTPIPGTSGLRK